MTLADLTTTTGQPDAVAQRVYHDTLVAARFVGIPWESAHLDALNNATADWLQRYPDRVLKDRGQNFGDVNHASTLRTA